MFWKKSGNKAIQNKIRLLVIDIAKTPYSGLGKPEPLKHTLSGKWSRRISKEDRIIYEIDEFKNVVIIHSLKEHY
ncbi:MAG: Txe/YoeB family addiction module toxin [Saprospiraceae bacterium]|nr:Txe/YoeB family addiction module toxin [Saprospiraceae bacterium]MBP6567315.1 Txe/YoeB family addiction module toxin [Saprospiraceae bacterium]